MRSAVKRLKDIVASKDIVPLLTHFIYRDGWLFASNGKLSAGCPVEEEIEGEFTVNASEFRGFLDKTEGPLTMSVKDNTLSVSCGNLGATFARLELSADRFDQIPETGDFVPLPEQFLKAVRAVRPFISDNATKPFATCVLLRGEGAYATSNIAIAGADSGLTRDSDFLIHYTVCDYLLAHSESLCEAEFSETGSAVFRWSDGGFLVVSGLVASYPNVQAVLSSIKRPDFDITPSWRNAVLTVERFGDQHCDLFRNEVRSRTDKRSGYRASLDSDCPFPENLVALQYDPRYVGPIFRTADKLGFEVKGGFVHISFEGDGVRGVGMATKI